MIASFLTVFPIFAVISAGWLAVRQRLVREETGNGISEYVFVIAIPLMLFRTLATAPLPDQPPWAFWASYFFGLAVVWVLIAVIAKRIFQRGPQESAIIGFTTAQSNMVLLGIPLILRVFGDEGSVPLFLMVAVHLPVTMSVATILIENAEPGTSKLALIARRLTHNPILIGIVCGGAFRLTGLSLPETVLATLKFIGDSAAPCALFASGIALSRYGLGGDRPLLTLVVALKLVIHPILVFLVARYVFALPPVWVGVATVLAGCPCGVNSYLLAERYRVGLGIASGGVAASTVLSVVTTTFLVWLVRGT
jgi:malonate transporter